MINQLAHNQQQFVHKIFNYIFEEKYSNAETEVVHICKKIIESTHTIKDRSSYLLMIDVLYSEFNEYYESWMNEQHKDNNTVIEEAKANIFIEHCSDPIKMEDLLWETANVLTSETTYVNA